MRLLPAAVSVLLVAAACGGDDDATVASAGDGAASRPPAGAAGTGEARYTATTTVLESPDHGPQLCLGGVMDSYPPQCGGPDVVGWDWDAVEDEESANGTTWGTYTVVGTWDGESLTLTAPPTSPEGGDRSGRDHQLPSTPCPEPEGGWQVVDASTTSTGSMDAAMAYARSQPSFGGAWVDQSINPALDEERIDESRANDPSRLILNVTFADDVARHERAVRDIWGGPLCVSEAAASAAELAEIRTAVEAEVDDFLYSGIDEVRGRVEIGVLVDDGLQDRFDERYGLGVVEVWAELRPVQP
jgi:hypothetical protein